MKQDGNQATEAKNSGLPTPRRPTAKGSRRWLETRVWTLPLLDDRSAEEILGYENDGLCSDQSDSGAVDVESVDYN